MSLTLDRISLNFKKKLREEKLELKIPLMWTFEDPRNKLGKKSLNIVKKLRKENPRL